MPAVVFSHCCSETDFNAMDFLFWTNLGTNFLIKSNTNNWISCSEGTGSLVNWRSGSLTCKIAKRVTKNCLKVLPNAIVVLTLFYKFT